MGFLFYDLDGFFCLGVPTASKLYLYCYMWFMDRSYSRFRVYWNLQWMVQWWTGHAKWWMNILVLPLWAGLEGGNVSLLFNNFFLPYPSKKEEEEEEVVALM